MDHKKQLKNSMIEKHMTEKHKINDINSLHSDKSSQEMKKAFKVLSRENELFSQFFSLAPFIENLSVQKQEKIWNDACSLLKETGGNFDAVRKKNR